MGTADRRAREKEELRDLILQGANKLFVAKGIEQTTIRNIAEEIDYSIGTVYVYFKDKNDILHALHSQGFRDMSGRFAVLASVADPMERLKAMGQVYIKFALENPEMYELMFSTRAPMDFLKAKEEDEWNEGKATFGALRSTVRECMSKGHFEGHELEALSYLIWSSVHGMCSLKTSHRAEGVVQKYKQDIVQRAYAEFVKMLDQF